MSRIPVFPLDPLRPDTMLAFSLSEMINSGALGLLLKGGFFMWPLLLLGILAVAVIIERGPLGKLEPGRIERRFNAVRWGQVSRPG